MNLTAKLGNAHISKMIMGGNPFSGFSHQGEKRNLEMMHYYTADCIKETLHKAERAGINAFIGRTDRHIMRMLMEYRDEGGTIQWIAQTASELDQSRAVQNAIDNGATACYIHGGMTDFLLANDGMEELRPLIAKIKDAGLPAGIAGHNPDVFRWAEDNLDLDFYMCAYYNSAHRDKSAELKTGMPEWFKPEDREVMGNLIMSLSKPTIHYKVLAAGRNNPQEALEFVVRHMKPNDMVCVGMFLKDKPNMIEENVRLFEETFAKK